MVKNNCFYFIFLCHLGYTTLAQKVSDITYRQEQSKIIVSYDLETKTPCEVNLFVSKNAGTNWQGPLKKVMGDIGAKIASGNHSITWNVLDEFEELRGDKIQFQVRADEEIETVVIGTQEWTTKNLNVSKYRNGDAIPEVKDPNDWAALTTGAWCYYNNDPKNGDIYGKLYNWYAVNDPRGLAPEGFQIPTNADLEKVKNLKDSAGIKGLTGGFRFYDGEYYQVGKEFNCWSSSEGGTTYSWGYYLDYSKGSDGRKVFDNAYGFSVRCIKN